MTRGGQLAAFNGLARGGLGAVAMIAPAVPLAPWVGEARHAPAARLLARALGARDLALAAGLLWAISRCAPLRPWLAAAALADAGDVAATVTARRHLPSPGRWMVLAAAAGGAATALAAAALVER